MPVTRLTNTTPAPVSYASMAASGSIAPPRQTLAVPVAAGNGAVKPRPAATVAGPTAMSWRRNAAPPTRAPPAAAANDMDDLERQIQYIQLEGTRVPRGAQVPSIAPPQSEAAAAARRVGTIANTFVQSYTTTNTHPLARYGWFKNEVCVIAPRKRRDFEKGDVISFPCHVPNMREDAECDQLQIAKTSQGPVYSKRRMAIVLFKTMEGLYCLPLYTFERAGISKKVDKGLAKDYMCVANYNKQQGFVNKGAYKPLLFVHKYADGGLDPTSCCHVTGAMMVGFNWNIAQVGRITEDSHEYLRETWESRVVEYSEEASTFPAAGAIDRRIF